MKHDFTKSKYTKGGYEVNGLFRDGKFIRGYLRIAGTWTNQTWYEHDGSYLITDPKGDLTLVPEPDEKPAEWWVHKVKCEAAYREGDMDGYYDQLHKLCALGWNLYGEKL